MKKIIVTREKHGNRYFDASTKQAFGISSLKILTERLNDGWYPEVGEMSAEDEFLGEAEINALPKRLQDAERRRNAEIEQSVRQRAIYQDWLERTQSVVESQDATTFVGRITHLVPKAYALLQERRDEQYESLEVVDIES